MSDTGKVSPDQKDLNSVEEQKEHVDLAHNVNAKIQNPLHGISKPNLMRQVEEFVRERGFEEHAEVFKKGALVAQNPATFESLQELTDEDREVLRREKTRKFN
jgi:hypothetical protein